MYYTHRYTLNTAYMLMFKKNLNTNYKSHPLIHKREK